MKAVNKELGYEHWILEIDNVLSKAFLSINPKNAGSERRKFLASKKYNPVFKYSKINLEVVESIFCTIENSLPKEGPLAEVWKDKADQTRHRIALLKSVGEEEFTKISKELYGIPSEELVLKAQEIMNTPPPESEESTNSDEVIKVATEALEKLGLKEWRIVEGNISANAFVLANFKRIRVRKDDAMPKNLLKRMLIHEIGTHVFRAYNGSKQPSYLFETGFPNYLSTEEGLAVNMEERYGFMHGGMLKTYAGRAVAVHMAQTRSFREIFKHLRKHFSEREAWKITMRAKRGLKDTSKPGGNTKDYIYLQGYFEVKEFLEKEGDEGLRRLYRGKVGIKDLEAVEKVPGLKEPVLLPDNMILREIMEKV
ncbi:DUF1704 domain-containing protein [Candidatus Woesearchaeota archaeon]|nr:DUF1704 domain-containing protein [Candidatus Woesearchaeota archaeon]